MRLRFSGIDLDVPQRQIWRGDRALTIEPQVFDLLVFLIRNRHRMVPKAELLDELWPDREVQEGALSVCVHRARKLLEDSGIRAIQTFPRRGFRFIAPVEVEVGDGRGTRSEEQVVGRSAELATLRGVVDDVLARHVRTVEIVGEAGIGKTTLLDETAAYARRMGMEVLRASASLHNDGNAFSLWAQVIGAHSVQRDPAVLRRVVGEHAEALGRMVPMLRRWVTPSSTADALMQSRVRLFDAVAQVVRAAALEQPLALLLDDLHWVDTDSLVMLRFVLGAYDQLPLLIAVAHRGESGQSEALAGLRQELARRRDHCTIELGGLPESDVHAVLERLASGTLPRSASTAATRATNGNPLWIEEWWRTALRDGALSQQQSRWIMHRDVDEVSARIGQQTPGLQAASTECRRMLQAVSVLQSQATPDLLLDVSELSPTELADARLEAEKLSMLLPALEANEPPRFEHPVVQERIYQQMDEAERVRLHRRAAEALERVDAGVLDEHVGLLAHHFLAGIDGQTAERAVRYAEEAGHRAFAALAFDRAATYFEHALEACERFRPDDRVRMWPSYLMLAESYLQAGKEERARLAYRDRVSVLSGDRLRRSSAEAEPQSPVGVARLVANMQAALRLPGAAALDGRGDLSRAERAAIDAVRRAEERSDPGALTHALIGQRWLDFVSALGPGHLAQSTQAVHLAESHGSPDLLLEARLLRIHDLLVAGRIDEVDREITAYGQIALATKEPAYRWVHLYLSAMRAHLAGELGESERLAEQALKTGSAQMGEAAAVVYWSQISSIRSAQGRFTEVLPWLETLIVQYPHIAVVQTMLCRAYCELGRDADAQLILPEAIAAVLNPDSTQRSSWLRAALTLARVLCHLGDATHAVVLLEKLEPFSEAFVVLPVAVSCGGPVSAFLGPLAVTAGLHDRAGEFFEAAIETLSAIHSHVLLAEVQRQYARFRPGLA